MLRRSAVLFTASAAVTALTCAPAAADLDLLTCGGTHTVTYDPGLRLFGQTVDIAFTDSFTSCSALSDPTLTSGLLTGSVTLPNYSCLSPVNTDDIDETVTWNNGQSSTFHYSRVYGSVDGNSVITSTGTVTSGKFAGATAVKVVTGLNLNLLACLFAPGVPGNTGTITLALTSL
ncbi:hypothetical protein [Actinocorallia sp. A-T 12471]|uniref:hypothetical protein n=1 Tax=Actinocorallia sp. A-T 12471 TaxID=3089813 RepID=UPI0029CFF142|nr:hypothetical protein [Actinocorallia sp. A-T 12471]MDX6742258.1 hypothetical protein [Actinocorallia sp. A-T 12471]